MKSGKVGKMATALTVMLLLLSVVAVVQWNAQPVEATESDEQTHNYTIEGFLDADISIESDLDIILRDLRTGEIEENQTSEDFYEFTDISPGWYEIIFPSQQDEMNGIAYMKNVSGPIEVDGNKIHDMDVEARRTDVVLDGFVFEDEAQEKPLEGATLTVECPENRYVHTVDTEKVEYNDENHSFYFEMEIFEEFQGRLKIEKEGYTPYVNVSFSAADHDGMHYNVTLYDEPIVEGRLVDEEGIGIREEMDITLYNEDVGLFTRSVKGPTFRIRAPESYTYTLVVDAPGYEPLVKEIEELTGTEKLGRNSVPESETEVFETDIEFDDDGVENLTVTSTRTLNIGTRMKTLDYSFLGNLPMQIDMALGNSDQIIGEDEIERLKERLVYSEADIPSTQDLIMVNDTHYELSSYETEFINFEEWIGRSITDDFDETLKVNVTREYVAVEEIGYGPYEVDLTVNNDHMYGNERKFIYRLDVMEGHERFIQDKEGSIESIPENVEVDGYRFLQIDPKEDGMTSHIVFDFREYEIGEAVLSIEREPWVFNRTADHYVIRKDSEVELICEYENPVSHAVNFTWLLNGEEIGYGENKTELTYAFNETDEKTLEVNIEESNSNIITEHLTIVVDDEGPQGTMIVRGEMVPETTTADEGEELNFSAENFEDAATGNISRYKWNFSDESEPRSGANLTKLNHTFDIPGSYNVTLNVTDPIGNWNEEMIVIKVNDTTEPDVIIRTEWNDEHSYDDYVDHADLMIDTYVTFNATESTAHPEYEGNLTSFEWWIEELGMNEEGPIWENVTFEDRDEYTIWVNVTDEAGNYRNESVTVNIRRGPTPNLMVHDLIFSEEDIRVGDTVIISVNVTNQGQVNATQIDTVLRIDGDRVDVSPVFYKDGEELTRTHIEPEEEIRIDMEWEPEDDGERLVNVNVTDAEEREHTDLLWNNEIEETVNIDPAAWREYVVYALIPIIIIGVTVGLYFYKDKIKELIGK